MIIHVLANKILKDGKYKVITKEGDFYHDAAVGLLEANVEFEIVPKDGKEFKRILKVSEISGAVASEKPSLPKTALSETPAPGGEPVVKKLESVVNEQVIERSFKPRSLSDYQKPWLPEESRKTQRASVVLNTIISPAYQELSMGKSPTDSLVIFDTLVAHYLTKLEEATKVTSL